MTEKRPVSISRTIYDPAVKDFVFDSGEKKALLSIRKWIDSHNPVIYWYILRIDNSTDTDISQWAVELYTHQALTIARRIYFKVDINCKEGLMHQYGILGAFMAQGMGAVEIKEKIFQYSCKVGEFRQIFDKNPDEASDYAKKRLEGRFSSDAVRIFTNSSIKDKASLAPGIMHLCDSLVELLHIEVMGAEGKSASAMLQEEDYERLERDRQKAEQERLRKQREEQEAKEHEKKRREDEQKEKFGQDKLKRYYDKGLNAFKSGDWEAAIAAFEQVVNIDHSYQDAAERLSLAASEKQKEEAEAKEHEIQKAKQEEIAAKLRKERREKAEAARKEREERIAREREESSAGRTSYNKFLAIALVLGVLALGYWALVLGSSDISSKSNPAPTFIPTPAPTSAPTPEVTPIFQTATTPSAYQKTFTNSMGMEFVKIPVGV